MSEQSAYSDFAYQDSALVKEKRMIHLVVCGHGTVAEGLLSGVKLLSGDVTHCQTVNFTEGMSSETLAQLLHQAMESAAGEPVLILTDIMGGTPFRQAALIASEREQCELISGVNLHMFVEAVIERDDAQSLEELAEDLVQSAQGGIARYATMLQNRIKSNILIDEEGI